MDDPIRRKRFGRRSPLRSFALGSLVGAAGAIATARRLRSASQPRGAAAGLAAFEDAPCFLEAAERDPSAPDGGSTLGRRVVERRVGVVARRGKRLTRASAPISPGARSVRVATAATIPARSTSSSANRRDGPARALRRALIGRARQRRRDGQEPRLDDQRSPVAGRPDLADRGELGHGSGHAGTATAAAVPATAPKRPTAALRLGAGAARARHTATRCRRPRPLHRPGAAGRLPARADMAGRRRGHDRPAWGRRAVLLPRATRAFEATCRAASAQRRCSRRRRSPSRP